MKKLLLEIRDFPVFMFRVCFTTDVALYFLLGAGTMGIMWAAASC